MRIYTSTPPYVFMPWWLIDAQGQLYLTLYLKGKQLYVTVRFSIGPTEGCSRAMGLQAAPRYAPQDVNKF
jgi:hypothetical protein